MTNSARGNDVEDDPSVTPRSGARHRRRADLPVLFKLGQRCCRYSAPGRCWRTGGQNKRACTVWLRQKGPRRPGSGNYSGARAIPTATLRSNAKAVPAGRRCTRRSRPGPDVAPQQSNAAHFRPRLPARRVRKSRRLITRSPRWRGRSVQNDVISLPLQLPAAALK
jgi:hypothetical protein